MRRVLGLEDARSHLSKIRVHVHRNSPTWTLRRRGIFVERSGGRGRRIEMEVTPWYPPNNAKWRLMRDMRLYIVGIAHLKWALRFQHCFLSMRSDDNGKTWKASRIDHTTCYEKHCHLMDWFCPDSGYTYYTGPVSVDICEKWRGPKCKAKHYQAPYICSACQTVYKKADDVDCLLNTDLVSDRDLCLYLERVQQALCWPRRRPWPEVCQCGLQDDHDAEHCWKCDCGRRGCHDQKCVNVDWVLEEDYKIAKVLSIERHASAIEDKDVFVEDWSEMEFDDE